MISDILIPAVLRRFATHRPRAGGSGAAAITVPARHSSFGDLEIWDEGDEAMICFGAFMHSHFGANRRGMSAEEIARQVTDDLVEFLDMLFTDRILFWRAQGGGPAGYWLLPRVNAREIELPEGAELLLWSGPTQSDGPWCEQSGT